MSAMMSRRTIIPRKFSSAVTWFAKLALQNRFFERLVVGISEPVLLLLTLTKLKFDGVASPSPIHLEGQL